MVPREELAWPYAHAAGYIQPSLAEGFGMPVVEAMQYEVPVASSNTTSLPETCGDAALFFDPSCAEDISRAAERLWKDETLRKSLIKKGRERCRAFSWTRTAEKIASVIDSTLSSLSTK